MYTEINFKNKKALKEAVMRGEKIRVYQPNDMFGVTERVSKGEHSVALEGPHYPVAHTWYASAKCVDGIVVSVK